MLPQLHHVGGKAVQALCQPFQFGKGAPLRKMSKGMEAMFDVLRRDGRGKGSGENGQGAVLDNSDDHRTTPAMTVG